MKNFISSQYILNNQKEDNLFLKDNMSSPKVLFIAVPLYTKPIL